MPDEGTPGAPGRRFTPSVGQPLKDLAYDYILEDVRCGEFPPGSEITEGQLVTRYGLSRAPIRSAFARLSQEGWLLPIPRRGHRVKPLTIGHVRDLFFTRKLIEPPVARMAAGRADQELLGRLDAACKRGYRAGDPDGERLFFEANKAFHIGIADAAGSARLSAIIAALHDESERVLRYGMRHLDWARDWSHGHEEILHALAAGDGWTAEKIALRQLEVSERVVVEALQRELDGMPISRGVRD